MANNFNKIECTRSELSQWFERPKLRPKLRSFETDANVLIFGN